MHNLLLFMVEEGLEKHIWSREYLGKHFVFPHSGMYGSQKHPEETYLEKVVDRFNPFNLIDGESDHPFVENEK